MAVRNIVKQYASHMNFNYETTSIGNEIAKLFLTFFQSTF